MGKNTKICSEHFKDDDFVFANLSLTGGRRHLKHDAIPSIFAWNKTNECMSLTSQKALQPPDNDVHVKQYKYLSLNNDVEEETVDILHDGMESVCDLDPSILDSLVNDSLVKFYTGFADYETLIAFYEEILESDASVMRQWSGRRSECDYDEKKVGPACKLSLIEQFF